MSSLHNVDMPVQGRVKPIPQIKQEPVWRKENITLKPESGENRATRIDLLSAATHIIIIIETLEQKYYIFMRSCIE